MHWNRYRVWILVVAGGCQSGSEGDGDFGGSAGDTSATSSGDASGTEPTGSTGDDDDEVSPPKLDVAAPETGGEADTDGPCGCGSDVSNYLWVANSGQGTISQIDTFTLEEVGRFSTSPGGGDPSRTSVSIDGRAVVVSNRANGSVTKVWAHESDCDESNNGVPGLQTSSGRTDVLGFGEDDCVQWHTTFDGAFVGRPVAWTPGTINAACEYVGQKVWTTVCLDPGDPAVEPNITVFLLDGDTGAIEAEIDVPDFPCWSTSAYGGAVDNAGNFFFHSNIGQQLGRIDLATLEVKLFQMGTGYGITVDTEGRVWFTAPVSRFDPQTGEQLHAYDHNPNGMAEPGGDPSGLSGLGQDQEGRIWYAVNVSATEQGIAAVDIDTMEVVAEVALPNADEIKGVSADVNGYVWAVDRSQRAFRYSPTDGDIDVYDGLDSPYTYSDMTGGQIQNVTCNPPAEG